MLKLILCTVLIAAFLPFNSVAKRRTRHGGGETGLPHSHSIEDSLLFQDAIKQYTKLIQNPSLLQKFVCEITPEEWNTLSAFIIAYSVDTYEINEDTGSLNFTTLGEGNDDVIDDFYAAKCDENFNLQPTMDSKITYIYKGYLKRRAHCVGMADRQVACKENKKVFI